MRSLRYLLESMQIYGGNIGKEARCIASVGADQEPVDLSAKYRWTKDHNIEFRWVDRELFREWGYDATGYDRFLVDSEADIVAMVDADLLFAGNIDDVVLQAQKSQAMLGFMAHVSPFGFEWFSHKTSAAWWEEIYKAAGLRAPELNWEYSGWGLDWSFYEHAKLETNDPNHRWGPPYFNFGFIVGPRKDFDRMKAQYLQDHTAIMEILGGDYGYTSQIANCLAFERLGIPCQSLPSNYNFPLNLPDMEFAELQGLKNFTEVAVFHYISSRHLFDSPDSIKDFLEQTDMGPAWKEFKSKLYEVAHKVGEL